MKISECDSDTIRHHVGNPAFAIETSISSLRRRAGHLPEVNDILDNVQSSVDKLKKFLGELED